MDYIELTKAVTELGMSERTIRRRVTCGELSGCKRGRKWWIAQDKAYRQFASESDYYFEALSAPPQSANKKPSKSPKTPAAQPPPSTASAANTAEPPQCATQAADIIKTADPIDHAFGVGRLAAWKKVREFYAFCQDQASKDIRLQCHEAMAMLFDGYLAYGPNKIESYRKCRSELCRMIVKLHETKPSEPTHAKRILAAHEALGAVQALIIRLGRKRNKEKSA